MIDINTIYNENCLDTMAKMPSGFVDLTVTSPPYDNLRDYKGYEFPFEEIAKELYRVTKEGGVVVWIVGDATVDGSETLTTCKQKIFFKESCGFNIHDTMIYEKAGFTSPSHNRYHQTWEYMIILTKGRIKTFNPIKDRKNLQTRRIWGRNTRRQRNGELKEINRGRIIAGEIGTRFNIWRYSAGGLGMSSSDDLAYKHPAIFPERLAADHIYSWSNEGDLVYDPFGGSGTTAKMAHLLKRNWIMSEISAEYCEVARKRLEPYLNQQILNIRF